MRIGGDTHRCYPATIAWTTFKSNMCFMVYHLLIVATNLMCFSIRNFGVDPSVGAFEMLLHIDRL